jgi:uncharacterized protein
MPPVSILIKPVSSSCNLQCKYCFYHDVAENRDIKNYGVMDHETLETLVRKTLEYGEYSVSFAFQGGEPTLAGLDFYREFITLQKKYNTKKLKICNVLQTNGTLIDEEWAAFLRENDFLVGLSLDGPQDIHDINRIGINGEGSYSRVEKAVKLLNKYEVKYNILCVVSSLVARHIEKIYSFLRKKGFLYLQFIPCLDELGKKPGQNSYSLTPKLYEDFLKRLFDLWYYDFCSDKPVSIRMFDNIVDMLLGAPPESCDMKGSCAANFVVEADGSIYPCDFYVLNQWKMGDIFKNDFQDMLQGKKAKKFLEISKKLTMNCKQCRVYFICRGGCRRHYEPIDGNNGGKNYFCDTYKAFYQYSLPKFNDIANIVRRDS